MDAFVPGYYKPLLSLNIDLPQRSVEAVCEHEPTRLLKHSVCQGYASVHKATLIRENQSQVR